MHVQPINQMGITLPLDAVKYLYRTTRGEKIVCEIDVKKLRRVNSHATIDDMVAEARLEYFAGQTKGFTKSTDLMKHMKR